MKTTTKLWFLIILTIMFVTLMWYVDISVSALLATKVTGYDFTLSNVVMRGQDPTTTYHIGLIGLIVIWSLVSLLLIYSIVKDKHE